ncbi:MAG: YIP1 family protein [Clostridia bacterium]|nr:YIP1 family protein [Clostridia bacterium]
MKKKITAVVLLLLAIVTLVTALPVSAVEPYQTYTYSIDGYALYSPTAYSPVMTVDSKYMGLLEDGGVAFDEASDIVTDKDKNVYIADTKNNRIVVLNEYFKLRYTISAFDNEFGATYSLSGPRGLFVTDEFIYVADTGNGRIVKFHREDIPEKGIKAGDFSDIIPAPQSKLFGNSASYKPVALAVDQHGRVFVISSTTYQGVIVMNEKGDFTGFIGAQKVTYSLIDIVWRRFMSEEQLANMQTHVSTEFNNITVDAEGFVYVTTDSIDEGKQIGALKSKDSDYSPVKKLNYAGTEIMKRNGFFDPGGEVDINKELDEEGKGGSPSKIKDVAIGPQDTWSIIDASRNKVFTYDQNGNLLFAFGDTGEMLGQMKGLSGIVYQGDNMILLDNVADTFTVYRRTAYGDLLLDALAMENERKYGEAVDAWRDVLMYNNNFDTAYIGVGKALHREGKYEEAMEYFKSAYDEESYSNSYREVRKNWISGNLLGVLPNILIIAVVVVGFCLILIKSMGYAARLNAAVAIRPNRTKTSYWEELMYSFHVSLHPFDGFWDLKHEKRGSVRAAMTFIVLVVVSFFYQSVGTGFIMNPQAEVSTIFNQIISVGVPVILWIISNWCLTTLFDGEGSFRDITVAVGYALAPMPIFLILSTLLSNIITLEEATMITLLGSIGYVWCAMLLFFGLMVTHGYSMGKNLLIVICTIVGMAVIIFMALLFSGLVGKMVSFVSSIITEIAYRV